MPSGPWKCNYWGHMQREMISLLFHTVLSGRVTPIVPSLSHFVVIDRLSLCVRLPVCSNRFLCPHFKWSSLGWALWSESSGTLAPELVGMETNLRHAMVLADYRNILQMFTNLLFLCSVSSLFENDCSTIAGEGALLRPVRQPVPQQLTNEVLTEMIPQPWLMRGSSAANDPQPLLLLRRM